MSWYGGGSRIAETVDGNMQGPESAETLNTKQKSPLWELLDTLSGEKMEIIYFLAKQIWLDLTFSEKNDVYKIKQRIEKLFFIDKWEQLISNLELEIFSNWKKRNLRIIAMAQSLNYKKFASITTKEWFIDFIIWLFKWCYIDINQLNDGDYENKKQLSTEIENIVWDLKNIFLLTLKDLNNIIVNYKTLYVILREKKYFDKPINNPKIYEYLQAICKLFGIDIDKLYDEFKKQLKWKKEFQTWNKTIKKNKIENFLKYEKPKDYYENLNKGSAKEEKNKAKDSIKSQIEQKVWNIKYIFLLELKEIVDFKVLNYDNKNNIMSFLKDEWYLEKWTYSYKQSEYVSAICKLLDIDKDKLYKNLQKELIEKVKTVDFSLSAQELWKIRLKVWNKKISLYTAYKLLDPGSDIDNKKFNKSRKSIENYIYQAIEKLNQS